jgi:hypothetical protein
MTFPPGFEGSCEGTLDRARISGVERADRHAVLAV